MRDDAAALAENTGLTVEVIDAEGRLYVRIADFRLPVGWAVAASPLLIITDAQYPHSALDMFWTDPSVVKADGSIAQAAEQIETYMDRAWRRFSWHGGSPGGPPPNPLFAHFAMIEQRLAEGC